MSEGLAFEIDFHPVGDGEKGGDAITIQYGRLNSTYKYSQKVIVIDGGTLASGEKIVEHIKNVYKTDTVDLIINTHPDNDHCSGLREVINNLTVKEIDPKHPAKKVTNALIRRNMQPFHTKGNILCWKHNTPDRVGYSSAIPIPFYNQVEE